MRRRDTGPEVALRQALHKQGLRFRVDRRPLADVPRRADLVFVRARVAVFVDGCFWHSCPIHHTFPKANKKWWANKLRANRRRDASTDRQLRKVGWLVARVWEHESPEKAASQIARLVKQRQRTES
jgi:DNA mismatch endonuclease (patch repair protein)